MIPNNGQWNVCPSSGTCVTTPVPSCGSLAPFNEDLTLAFRGPMHVQNIGIYVPDNNGWEIVSHWDTTGVRNNLVWMNNAGDWSICQGNAQSYMNSAGTGAASTPQSFNGVLGNDVNVNIMSNVACDSTVCPGFYRGVAKVGWKGNQYGEKMFAVTVIMPHDTSGSNNNDMPAIWFLNGQIVRTNQWGCNCRGMGAAGGCGELDVSEVIPGRPTDECTSTLYGFKQSLGCNDWFVRPVSAPVTYVIVFNASGSGKVSIIEQDNSFSYASNYPQAVVNQWISAIGPSIVSLNNPFTSANCPVITAVTADETTNGAMNAEMWIGIVVGVVVFLIVIVVIVVFVVLKRKRQSEIV